MSLKDALDAYKAAPKPNFRPEFGPIVGRTIAGLVASGQAERAAKAGERAPALDLPDSNGARVTSADLLKKGPLVISFYRGVWCPFCNIELKATLAPQRDAMLATGVDPARYL